MSGNESPRSAARLSPVPRASGQWRNREGQLDVQPVLGNPVAQGHSGDHHTELDGVLTLSGADRPAGGHSRPTQVHPRMRKREGPTAPVADLEFHCRGRTGRSRSIESVGAAAPLGPNLRRRVA